MGCQTFRTFPRMLPPDTTALVTGGASGIGRLTAELLLERGARVLLWDIDRPGLQRTVDEFSRKGDCSGRVVDLSDSGDIAEAAEAAFELLGDDIGHLLIVNNAGIVVGKHFHEHTTTDIRRTSAINAEAPQLITRAFLPAMMRAGTGHVCNIASSAGLVANPKMSAYAASKWSLVGWSESLRVELEQLGHDIAVTTVCPYYIDTGMFDGVKSRIPILEPERAAADIVRAIERRSALVTLPGYIYRLTRLSQGLLSVRGLDWFAGNVFGVYKTMEGWTGRR